MDRYEIGDRMCGVINRAESKEDAFQQAVHYQTKHPECMVTVFDRMAHHGNPDQWHSNKDVLHIRHTWESTNSLKWLRCVDCGEIVEAQ